MIEVFIQLNEPSARLDKLRYWKKSEAGDAQKLQPELEELLVRIGRYGPMDLITSLGNHLLENYNFGPWKLVLMLGTKEGFTLEFAAQFKADLKEIQQPIIRVSRYDRTPVI